MKFPTPGEADWEDYQYDLDTQYAYDRFNGISFDTAKEIFRKNDPIGCAEDLRNMPEKAFQYYMPAFTSALQDGVYAISDKSDAASAFLSLVLDKLKTQPRHILPLMPDILPTAEQIAKSQEKSAENLEIYGNFMDHYNAIHNIYENVRTVQTYIEARPTINKKTASEIRKLAFAASKNLRAIIELENDAYEQHRQIKKIANISINSVQDILEIIYQHYDSKDLD